jgi:hypothetical protein
VNRVLVRVVYFATVVLAALFAARLLAEDRRYALGFLLLLLVVILPAWLSRRRMRQLLLSGDVRRVLGSWQGSLRRVTYPETMAPLMTATAYAAFGFIEGARTALERAARGPAWDAAVEQRLFVEALLDVYEGERSSAMTKAEALERLPLPRAGFWMRRKVALLRRGVGALARAFAHSSRGGDERLLLLAGRSSPLVHWAMRYGRAVFLVDAGRREEARALLSGAPAWPEESAFRAFHDELSGQTG